MSVVSEPLIRNPGASVYFIVTLITLVWALILSIRVKQSSSSEFTENFLPGVVILLILQLFSFVTNFLIWADPVPEFNILIIIDQVISILGMIWLFWIIVPLVKRNQAGVISGGLSLLVISMAIFGGIAFFQPAPYNIYINAWVVYIWQLLAILLCLSGVIWLLVNRPVVWSISLVILLIALSGHLLDLFNQNSQFIPGMVRLCQMLYLPLLVYLTHKHLPSRVKPVIAIKDEYQRSASLSKETRIDLTPTVTASLLTVSLQKSRKKILNSLTHSISLFMVADICCLALFDESTQTLQITNGYDLIRQDYLKDFVISRSQAPELFASLDNAQLLVIKNSRSTEVESLQALTGYNQLGIVSFFPLKKNGDLVKSGLLFMTPYTFRRWNEDEFDNLEKVSLTILRVIENSSDIEKQKNESEGMLVSLNQAMRENDKLQEKYERCQELLTEIRNEFNSTKVSHQEEIQNWISQQRSLEEEIQKLTEVAEKSKSALNDIQILQDQKLDLQRSLEQSNKKIENLKSTLLRTKTLIEESVSAQFEEDDDQDKDIPEFSIESDQLHQNEPSNIDGTFETKIRLTKIMEDLRKEFQNLMDQKRLSLNTNFGQVQDMILTDGMEIEKILRALLRNAVMVSPSGKEIQIDFDLETSEDGTSQLTLQVTDQGGGLSRQEQSTFFNMIDRHGQPVPGGIGDASALREVINLVRSQKGKLLMKSDIEKPTAYKIRFPLSNEG